MNFMKIKTALEETFGDSLQRAFVSEKWVVAYTTHGKFVLDVRLFR